MKSCCGHTHKHSAAAHTSMDWTDDSWIKTPDNFDIKTHW